jgi:hypothetical protein
VAVWVLAVAAATGGCSDGGDGPEGAGEGGPDASSEAAGGPETAGGASEEPPAATDPATAAPARARLAPATFDVRLAGAVGPVVLATQDGEGYRAAVGSTDLGATWAPLALPGAPSRLDVRVHVLDGAAVVGGVDHLSDPIAPYLWTSSDGVTWRGGRAEGVTAPAGGVRSVSGASRQDDGTYVAVVTDAVDVVQVVLTSEDGAVWRAGDCPRENRVESACLPVATAGELSLPTGEPEVGLVSLDRGDSWQRPTVGDVPVVVYGAVELPGGGWLGATSALPQPDGSQGLLVRSGDGVRWSPVIAPDPCDDVARPRSWYTGPVPFGDGWLVAYSCEDSVEPHLSQLYLLDAEGANPRVVEGTAMEDALHGPVAVLADGTAVVQAYLHQVPTGTALTLRP